MSEPPDAELVARVIATADTRAFETLVRRHQAHVRAYVRSQCLDASLADDIAQDAFLSAYRNIGSYRAEARFSTWLLAIAHNALRQALRARSRLERLRDRLFREPAEDEVTHAPESPARRLHAALARLEPDERSVVVLSHMHELSHGEIAALTRLPLGTVKSHAARGKAKLRELLTEEVTHNGS